MFTRCALLLRNLKKSHYIRRLTAKSRLMNYLIVLKNARTVKQLALMGLVMDFLKNYLIIGYFLSLPWLTESLLMKKCRKTGPM